MNKNPKVRQYTNEPYFSFENFMFSNLARVTTEEKCCRICERKTNGAYFYRDKTYYAHFECLSTYFLYQFFEITDTSPTQKHENEAVTNGTDTTPAPKKQISLTTIYDINMEDEVGNGTEENVCYSCGIGDVYFKCLVENCNRHIHMECAGNGCVIVYTTPLSNLNLFTMLRNKQVNGTTLSEEASNGDMERERVMEAYLAKNIVNVKDKQISYRFLVCYKHATFEVINEIKLQFLAKMVQVTEYQYIHAMLNVLRSYGATQTAPTPYAKAKEEAKKEEKKGRGYYYRTNPNLTTNYTYQSRTKAPEREDTPSSQESISKREENRRNVLLINNMVYEYNQYKKTNIQKIAKPLTSSSFSVLFQPLTTIEAPGEAGEGEAPAGQGGANRERDREDAAIENDIKALLSVHGASAINHVNELNKLNASTEHNIQNIVSIIKQLLWPANAVAHATSIHSQAGANADYEGNGGTERGREMLEREVFRVTTRKPRFVIMRLYNKFLWMAVMQLSRLSPEGAYKPDGPEAEASASGGTEATRTTSKPNVKTVILEYTPITNVDYVYLKNSLNSLYNRNVLLMHHNQHKLNAKLNDTGGAAAPKAEAENQEWAKNTTKDKHAEKDTINLCGYSWDLNPPLYKMQKTAGQAKESPGPRACPNATSHPTKHEDDFVHKQSIALMSALKSINTNIESFKTRIEANIAKDATKYKNLCFNPTYVQLYQNVANALHRFNHFKQSIRKSMLHFNNPAISRRQSTQSVPSTLSEGTASRRPSEQSDRGYGDPRDELALNEDQLADDEDEIIQEKEAEDKIRKEYCSVCLLSEFSHKHVLMQCQKCYLRVHYKCYFNYALAPAGTAGAGGASVPLGGALKSVNTTSSTVASSQNQNKRDPKDAKDKDDKNTFFCDPCKTEYNHRYETTYNSAICVACQSSGGAMKSIFVVSSAAAAAQGRDASEKEERWIHLTCLVFVMPRITCHDINNLGRWHIVHNSLNYMNTCSICGAVGGIQVECCYTGTTARRPEAVDHEDAGEADEEADEDETPGGRCGLKFHPMCCLLSGCYIKYSTRNTTNLRATELKTHLSMFTQATPINNPFATSCMDPGITRPGRDRENAEKFQSILNNLFQAIILEPLCVKHTIQVCTEKFLNEQCTKRCFAYTHYLYNPDGFKSKKKYNALPLEPIYSPVTITRSGPIKSQPRILPQHYSKKFSYEIMAKRVKHNEPYLISVIYGLPKNMCGDGPKYGITAIANYLSNASQRQNHTRDSGAVNHTKDGRPNHDDRRWFPRPNHQPQFLPSK